MKKLFIPVFLLFLFTAVRVFAEDPVSRENDSILAEITLEYNKMPGYRAEFIYETYSEDKRSVLGGTISFLPPEKYRVDFQSDSGRGHKLRTLMVYDGSILWQEQEFDPDKRVKIIKARVGSDYLRDESLIGRFCPRDFFEMLRESYDLLNVERAGGDFPDTLRLDFRMKEKYAQRWTRLAEAEGTRNAGGIIPVNVSYFWSEKEKFCRKTEIYSPARELLNRVEYAKVIKKADADKKEFSYLPKPKIELIDITGFLKQENRSAEYEGVNNRLCGTPAPDFILKDAFGKQKELRQYRGKIVILDFWEYGCGPCRKELPLIDAFFQEIETEPDIRLLTITSDRDKALELVDEEGYMFPMLIDSSGKTARNFQAASVPRVFVIDKEGRIVSVYIGYHDDIKDILLEDVRKLKPGEE